MPEFIDPAVKAAVAKLPPTPSSDQPDTLRQVARNLGPCKLANDLTAAADEIDRLTAAVANLSAPDGVPSAWRHKPWEWVAHLLACTDCQRLKGPALVKSIKDSGTVSPATRGQR